MLDGEIYSCRDDKIVFKRFKFQVIVTTQMNMQRDVQFGHKMENVSKALDSWNNIVKSPAINVKVR